VSEAELQQAVADLCARLGLFHYHPLHSIGSAKGWPDSVIVGHRVLFRELKSASGSLTPEQKRVGYRLRAAGANWDVWRPKDWTGGTILKQLREISGVQGELWEETA
jgi:hypothetical protein